MGVVTVSDNGTTRVDQVTDAQGNVIGTNTYPSPGSPGDIASTNYTAMVANLNAYLALANPSAAQNKTAADQLIRLVLHLYQATS